MVHIHPSNAWRICTTSITRTRMASSRPELPGSLFQKILQMSSLSAAPSSAKSRLEDMRTQPLLRDFVLSIDTFYYLLVAVGDTRQLLAQEDNRNLICASTLTLNAGCMPAGQWKGLLRTSTNIGSLLDVTAHARDTAVYVSVSGFLRLSPASRVRLRLASCPKRTGRVDNSPPCQCGSTSASLSNGIVILYCLGGISCWSALSAWIHHQFFRGVLCEKKVLSERDSSGSFNLPGDEGATIAVNPIARQEYVDIIISAKTTGWLGLGFYNRTGSHPMIRTDIVLGWVSSGGAPTERQASHCQIDSMDKTCQSFGSIEVH
eukprot:109306-Amphidinium_carterae.1